MSRKKIHEIHADLCCVWEVQYDPFIFAIGEAGPFLLHLILKFRKAIGSASWPTVETAGLVTWLAGLVIFFQSVKVVFRSTYQSIKEVYEAFEAWALLQEMAWQIIRSSDHQIQEQRFGSRPNRTIIATPFRFGDHEIVVMLPCRKMVWPAKKTGYHLPNK